MASCASSWQLILYMCACVCARVCVLPFGSYRRLIYIAVTSTCPQHATIWLTSFGRMFNWLNWYCCYYCCCCYISIDLASTCCCFCWPNKNCDYLFCLIWCFSDAVVTLIVWSFRAPKNGAVSLVGQLWCAMLEYINWMKKN